MSLRTKNLVPLSLSAAPQPQHAITVPTPSKFMVGLSDEDKENAIFLAQQGIDVTHLQKGATLDVEASLNNPITPTAAQARAKRVNLSSRERSCKASERHLASPESRKQVLSWLEAEADDSAVAVARRRSGSRSMLLRLNEALAAAKVEAEAAEAVRAREAAKSAEAAKARALAEETALAKARDAAERLEWKRVAVNARAKEAAELEQWRLLAAKAKAK